MTGARTTPAEAPPPTADHWWAAGLALGERLAAGVPEPAGVHPDADARAEEWRRACDRAGPGHFGQRLAEAGTDESGLLALLAEGAEALGRRTTCPAWAAFVTEALRIPPLAAVGPEASGPEVFAGLLHPLVVEARQRLARRSQPGQRSAEQPGERPAEQPAERPGERPGEQRSTAGVDGAALLDDFAVRLGSRLAAIAAPTLVTELRAAAARGELSGPDGRERFVDFVRRLAAPGRLAELFGRYPVLGRLLGQAAEQAVRHQHELLTRYAADRAAIVAHLFGGRDPGRLVAVAELGADRHRGGRAVAALVFSGGQRVVYKPRTVEAHVRLAGLLDWLNGALPGIGLRMPVVLARDGYGWAEFLARTPVADPAGLDRFYRRQGALLAVLHLVRAVDIHHENVVACGEHPVLVDVETMFHPVTPGARLAADPAAERLASSVHRTGMLPLILVGAHGRADISGLGGDGATPGGAACWVDTGTDRMRRDRRPAPLAGRGNRARLDGIDRDPADHEPALLAGFRAAYHAIMQERAEVAALLRRCADVETRVVVRPTQLYRTLLGRASRPAVLRDGLDRDRALDALRPVAAELPGTAGLVRHELAELWAGDVPLFTGTPSGTAVRAGDGTAVEGVFDRPALAGALEQLAAMSDANLRDQEWIISATLATRREPSGHRGGPGAGARDAAAEPARLLAGARGIADQLVAVSARRGDEVNWLGLELVDERQWLVLPMGAGLATGYTGVALFLAELFALTGVQRYATTARAAIGRVPQLLTVLSGSDAAIRAVGCGGMTGFAGIAYALARLANRLGDAEPRDWTRSAIDLAGRSVTADAAPGVFSGLAGCLAAMTAIHEELDLPEAAALARRCAALLADRAEQPLPHPSAGFGGGAAGFGGGAAGFGGGAAGFGGGAAGFGDGAAGVGWALARYAGSAGAGPDAARCGRLGTRLLLAAATSGGDEYGWCAGRAGVQTARYVTGIADDPAALDGYAARPVLRDLSLCHGELGILEALAVRRDSQAARVRRRRAGQVAGAMARGAAGCGTPGGVPTPGLLDGLAGIGYGLLRAGFPEQVPSVLLLAPSR
ncbi:type 2 lanthipeptide synthetase LanM family protein [Plantactinospora sp. WMMB334]|uniref:type 2 lanthipeptide synthetase LanM family protein n=1 Tax=Plantactinospora sp. WMMB334 TaxID=3404119 RepID=UPI003B942EA2